MSVVGGSIATNGDLEEDTKPSFIDIDDDKDDESAMAAYADVFAKFLPQPDEDEVSRQR